MIKIDHTCIKGKNNGIYKAVTPTFSVVTEEKPEETTTPIYPEVYPEVDCPDFDSDRPIDYPDYDTDYGLASVDFKTDTHLDIDSKDFDSIVHEVKTDIANDNFLEKCIYYMDLLKVDRQEFDDYLIYELGDIYDDDFDPSEIIYQVKEVKVFDRLFQLYCPDTAFVIPPKTNHYLREYVDRLEPDGRYFPKKQLTLFGEDK